MWYTINEHNKYNRDLVIFINNSDNEENFRKIFWYIFYRLIDNNILDLELSKFRTKNYESQINWSYSNDIWVNLEYKWEENMNFGYTFTKVNYLNTIFILPHNCFINF